MITVDSPGRQRLREVPPEAQAGPRGPRACETVGDLLFHFPRRYVKTNELSEVAEPVEGEPLSVVGRITASEVKTFQRPPHPAG